MPLKHWKRTLVLLAGCWFGSGALAAPLDGTRTLFLVEPGGARHDVAAIHFTATDAGATYEIAWRDERFSDHFLSMRPFKCLEGPQKYWCRISYPYPNRRTVSKTDLVDLEYDTLFIWKGSKEYGINMWNGVYYRLRVDGDRIVGHIHEMDMDRLSAPPDAGNLRPVREMDLEPGEADSHWLPKLIIE